MPLVLAINGNAQHTGSVSPTNRFTIHSKILNQERTISIYKPPSMEEFPESVSPVMYLLDGELVAEMVRAQVGYFCEIWRELPPITVVGIENLPGKSNRNNDLTYTKSKNNVGGGGQNFLRFIEEELMPIVEKDHKQKPYRILVGSSLGGSFTVYTFLTHSDLFDAYVASSPSLYRNNNEIMNGLEQKIKETNRSKKILFFAVGNEGANYVPHVMKLDSLLTKHPSADFRHHFVAYPGEQHGTTPMKSYYDGFKFIFRVGDPALDIPFEEISYEKLEDYYKDRSFIFRTPIKVNEFITNGYGYRFLYEFKQVDKALIFFSKGIENFPNSSNAYSSYAEALLVLGDKEKALMNYQKALRLNPGSKTAASQIARLQKDLGK